MSEEQRRQLQLQLWNIANTLRGKMNADEFRDYILGFIFYKYLSEKIQHFCDGELAQEGLKFATISETTKEGQAYIEALHNAALDELGYFLKPSELFHAIAKKGNNQLDTEGAGDSHNFILDDLTRILKNIEQSTLGTDSADDFVNLFEDLDLTSSKLGKTVKEKNDIVSKVLSHLDNIDFNLSDTEGDVLGDAYEYLIGQFASGAGKKAGEFYTPQPVSTLLAKLVTDENKQIRSIYDAACGSGSLLLRVKKVYDPKGDKKVKIYGQELNRTTYNLCRMNMIMHDVHYADFDIKQEDTLERPQHRDMRFDAIVANPPFSAHWNASPLMMNDDRYSQYGKLAPSTKADMAFVQHMLHHLSEDGTMAIILPHGVLFRGAAEGHIRQYLIAQLNYLDAVIGLPANIFYGTSIPTCVLVFKKCRKHPDNILFIDASHHFDKVKTQNVIRSEHIQKIVDAYKARMNEEKYSHVASLEKIKANDYNLNIPRYVDTFEAEDVIDLSAIAIQLAELDEASKATNSTIAAFCNELGISPPFAAQGQQA
jgi:type I restriction enzyme M protein